MFDTEGTISEEMFKEIYKKLIPMWYKILIFSTGFIVFINILINLGNKNYTAVLFSLLMGVLIVLTYKMFMNSTFKKVMKMLEENYNKRELRQKVRFDDKGAILENLETGSASHIDYENISEMCNVYNGIVILGKSKQWFFVFTSCFKKGELEEFRKFIKEKCPKIKMV